MLGLKLFLCNKYNVFIVAVEIVDIGRLKTISTYHSTIILIIYFDTKIKINKHTMN